MNGYLIDTKLIVLSEFGRSHPPEPKVKQWIESADPQSPAQRRPGLEQWLERDLRDWFQSRLLPVTKTIADRWGILAGQSKLQGKALTMADGIILATPWNTISLS